MPTDSTDPLRTHRRVAYALTAFALVVAPVNLVVFFTSLDESGADGFNAFLLLCLLQTLLGLVGCIAGIALWVRLGRRDLPTRGGIATTFLGILAGVGGIGGLALGIMALAIGSGGGAWGRPLRIRGRVRHPELRRGDDWTRGERPDASGLDAPTRAALEALWLHDAQKEHASVPAFSRVAWMLSAVGAPAELLSRTFRAAQEEIEHTELCFALAAGYGGRTHTVEPMPELLLDGALEVRGNALVHLAVESLKDGCLLEDYNADVAARCAEGCEEPVTRRVLETIAVEERSHAELSWSIVAFCLRVGGEPVRVAVAKTRGELSAYERPTAADREKAALVAKADASRLRAHGRIPDSEWAALYELRLEATRARAEQLLSGASDADLPARGAASARAA